jgi:hypothetical protein
MAKPPVLLPLTTGALKIFAQANGIGVGPKGILQNRAIGLAFQDWVLWSIQKPENFDLFTSPARQSANKSTGGLPGQVRPDVVWDLNIAGDIEATFDQSLFYEVKAVTGVLTRSASKSQILGFIDVLAVSAAATSPIPQRPPPALEFITTSNTSLDQSVVDYGNQRTVAIWQVQVFYDATSASPGNPDLYMGQENCLNPTLYSTPFVVGPLGSWRPGPLTSPTTPPTSLIVPNDPDPDSADLN